MQAPDITKDPTLYVVPYAHLDTQWRWESPGSAPAQAEQVESEPLSLNYDVAASNDDTRTEGGGFDGAGNAFPAEMLSSELTYDNVRFQLAPAKTGTPDAVAANGQTVPLPSGHFNRVYILAAPMAETRPRRSKLAAARRSDGGKLGRFHWPVGHTALEE